MSNVPRMNQLVCITIKHSPRVIRKQCSILKSLLLERLPLRNTLRIMKPRGRREENGRKYNFDTRKIFGPVNDDNVTQGVGTKDEGHI